MKPRHIIALCFLALGLMAASARAMPDGGPPFDASMSMGASTVAPLQVVTASPPAPSFFAAHRDQLLFALGLWVLIASIVNARVPMPKSPPSSVWLVRAHLLFLDLPSFLASPQMRGVIGRLSIPFLDVSVPDLSAPLPLKFEMLSTLHEPTTDKVPVLDDKAVQK